ncbi:hypothetical protein QBC37DRAFT_440899 [Rhypophila decipiens]|uniref:DUF7580 domain-containing protein n=1 Tax=Rhypophila decipiens TaxID=261697 RepID=A0AAN6Y6Y7_9PEZI|nr:hypothetical protein QBC37DRAFT_440899 [Rhypophila decipiens]
MSGFEVAGIVLGSIPLLISALEHYGDGVRTIQKWRKYESELRSVVRNLKTERVKLLNVCEKLLDGLVPASMVDTMVEDPFGELWQEQEIKRKIGSAAIDEAMEKLNTEGSSVMRELKRVTFMFKRPAYTELLSTIRDGVSSLESLTIMSIDLEPKRRARSDVRFLSILRGLSSSLYRAVSSSLACACKHKVLMRLSTWSADITPEHDEEDIIQDLKFRLALSSESGRSAAPNNPQEQSTENSQTISWEEILLQANTVPQRHAATDSSAALSRAIAGCAPVRPATKRLKSVSFASFKSTTVTTATKSSTLVSTAQRNKSAQQQAEEAPLISNLMSKMTIEVTSLALSSVDSGLDLCGQLRKALGAQSQQEKVDCYGVVFDPDAGSKSETRRSYTVYPVPKLMAEPSSSWRVVSLREVLEGKDGLPPLGYRNRLQLAVFIARSVLQLYKTAWLPETPSSRNVFFVIQNLKKDGRDSFLSSSYYVHAFVMAGSSGGTSGKNEQSGFMPLIRNPTLLALGVLLIELEKNKTLDSMRLPEEVFGGGENKTGGGARNLVSDYMTAQRLLKEVEQTRSNYGSAVRRCLDCEFRTGGGTGTEFGKLDLESEDLRQEVYAGVVALLEEDLGRI